MPNGVTPGERAPAFKLPTSSGEIISTADLKGRPYVVYFYPKDDTSGCTKEAIAFSVHKRKFDALGITIVGISKDSAASHAKFAAKHQLKITLASDPDVESAQAYGVWIEERLYGRRYMGMDRATFLVDADGIVRRVWRKVRLPGHVEAVLDAAKSL